MNRSSKTCFWCAVNFVLYVLRESDCDDTYCMNNGTCYDVGDILLCACTTEFYGTTV